MYVMNESEHPMNLSLCLFKIRVVKKKEKYLKCSSSS